MNQKLHRTVEFLYQAFQFKNPFRKIALDKLTTSTLGEEETTQQLRSIAKAGYIQIVETALNPKLNNSRRNRLINCFCEQVLNEIIKIDKKMAKSSDLHQDKKIKYRYLIDISPHINALVTPKHTVVSRLKAYVDTEIEKLTTEGFKPETRLERIVSIISEDPITGKVILRPFCGRP